MELENEKDKVWDAISSIKSDIKEIRDALLGTEYGGVGHKQRITKLEIEHEIIKGKVSFVEVAVKTIIGIVAAAGALIGLLQYFKM